MRNTTLEVDAFTRDDLTELAKGKLATIDNQIDQTTGTFKLKAIFSNENHTLWPDQFVNARMQLDVKKNAIIIPSAAVQTGSQGSFVYVISSDKKAQVKNIQIGLNQGNVSQVNSGISAGDQVVVDGQDKLQEGTLVDAHVTAPVQIKPTPPSGNSPIARQASPATNAPSSRTTPASTPPPVQASTPANNPPASSKRRGRP